MYGSKYYSILLKTNSKNQFLEFKSMYLKINTLNNPPIK